VSAQVTKLKVGAVARAAGISEQCVRDYAEEGLLECEFDSSGHRLFNLERQRRPEQYTLDAWKGEGALRPRKWSTAKLGCPSCQKKRVARRRRRMSGKFGPKAQPPGQRERAAK
jgi:hypothetical protein